MNATTPSAVRESQAEARTGSPGMMLVLATIGFAVNFWAWTLISPLGPMFGDSGALGELSESDVLQMHELIDPTARPARDPSRVQPRIQRRKATRCRKSP